MRRVAQGVLQALHVPPCLKTDAVTCRGRTEPLAAVTVPVLHWRSESVCLRYVDASRPDIGSMSEPTAGAVLPVGFRALWLQTSYMCVEVAGHSLDAELSDIRGIHAAAAAELCRFLALAPACYKELRLLAVADRPRLSLVAVWLSTQETILHRARQHFHNLQAVAEALRRFADDYGLAVSSCDTFISVVRIRPWPVSSAGRHV